MTTRGRPPNRETPTWVKVLIKEVWAYWKPLHPEMAPPDSDHYPPTASAHRLRDFLNKRTPADNKIKEISVDFEEEQHAIGVNSGLEKYLPNERTIQRIISEYRVLRSVIYEMYEHPAVPLGEGWPTDSDDAAFLLALVQSWGPSFHPDVWNDSTYWTRGRGTYRDEASSLPGVKDPENQPFYYDPGARQPLAQVATHAILDEIQDGLLPNRRILPLPLSRDEIKVAIEFKGMLGWPGDFENRQQWWVDYPMFAHEIPGELAILKEVAIRKAYSEKVDSFDGESADILGILAHRPWRQGAVGSEYQLHPILGKNYIGSNTSTSIGDNSKYSLDSIVPNGSRGGVRQLAADVRHYFDSGSQVARKRAYALLDDIAVPDGIMWAMAHWYSSDKVRVSRRFQNHMSQIMYWKAVLGFLDIHHWLPERSAIVPQEHQPIAAIEAGPIWKGGPESRLVWKMLDTAEITEFPAGVIWCAGCKGAYVPTGSYVPRSEG